ncbi:MAG: sigma factor-like helix-turn-helix DNA-binding protein [Rubrivivax sp.]|nr:sigma factor-like helix-turn-helix DNA-binding protein [Rubrivivax sp.]
MQAAPVEDEQPEAASSGTARSHEVALAIDLQRALAQLSEPERAAIAHCYFADLTHAEAAQVQGWPLGTL